MSGPAPKQESRRGAAKPEDGRTLRSASTRKAVAEAYLNLLDAGDMRPTAKAIAAAAGCSERAVFRHFQDMETLHSEAAAIQIRRVSREVPGPVAAGGAARDRAEALAHRWGAIHDRVTPVRRVALLHEPFSAEIASRLRWVRDLARAEVEQAFAEELGGLDPAARRRKVAMLCAALTWESWNEIRRRHELEPSQAEAAVAEALLALVAGLSPD